MNWQRSTLSLDVTPSENLTNWLAKPYILSSALRRVCTKVSLTLISEKEEPPFADEVTCLEKSLDQKVTTAFVRKILLFCDETPVIFARTVVPPATFAQFKQQLEKLGGAFIGETLLYGNEDIIRQPFEFSCFNQQHPMRIEAKICVPTLNTAQLWARRSTFSLLQNPLLITECYLPALDQIIFVEN